MLALFLCLAALPHLASAQIQNNFECFLGIFDNQGMTSSSGTIGVGVPKEIYLGIILKGAQPTGVTGVECSITGVRQVEDGFALIADPIVPAAAFLGTLPAPVDTSASTSQTGGANIAWTDCIAGSQALVKLTLISFAAVPADKVIQVRHRYPVNDPGNLSPLIFACDAPVYTSYRIKGGCYVLNPTGPAPASCLTVAVAPETWSTVKGLFR